MDAMKQALQARAGDGELHGANGFDADGLGVIADDLQSIDQGHALVLPDAGFEIGGISAFKMCADKTQCRAGAGHDDAGDAIADDGGEAGLIQIDSEGLGDAIDAAGEMDGAAGIEDALEGNTIVSLAIRGGSFQRAIRTCNSLRRRDKRGEKHDYQNSRGRNESRPNAQTWD